MTEGRRKFGFALMWVLYAMLFGYCLAARFPYIVGLMGVSVIGLVLWRGKYQLKLRYFLLIAIWVSLISSSLYILLDRDVLDETRRLLFFYRCVYQTVSFATMVTVLQFLVRGKSS